jgi:hypothetical protein
LVEDWVFRTDPSEPARDNGVEWRLKVGRRRLASTGREVIDFDWSIKYTGPRPPLIILEPTLERTTDGQTCAEFYVFQQGVKVGRRLMIRSPYSPLTGQWGTPRPPDRDWFLNIPAGRTERGRVSLAVAELKRRLVALYPAEFGQKEPPKVYVEFAHKPWDRGLEYDLDAWTGDLKTYISALPPLKTWSDD